MQKYIETRIIEKVNKSLKDGLAVEGYDGHPEGQGHYAKVERRDNGDIHWHTGAVVPLRSGRCFRIEVPKPEAPDGYEILDPDVEVEKGDMKYDTIHYNGWLDLTAQSNNEQRTDFWYARKKAVPAAWTGPTCEITPELLKKFRESCKRFLVDDGKNSAVKCSQCPGSFAYNHGISCVDNLFRSISNCPNSDPHRTENAKCFLAEHPEIKKPKMVRVEFCRSSNGWLGFGKYPMENAPTVLGPGGYEYAEQPGSLFDSPSLFYRPDLKMMCGHALLSEVESGVRVPVRPVAYWYFSKET